MTETTASAAPQVSLGAQLLQARVKKAQADTAFAREEARKKNAEAQAKFERVENFFKHAQTFFTERILAGDTKPFIGIGGDKYREFSDVERLLLNGRSSYQMDKVLESKTHPYYPLWRDFQDWARTQQLNVAFRYQHDGVGMWSWHELVADPMG